MMYAKRVDAGSIACRVSAFTPLPVAGRKRQIVVNPDYLGEDAEPKAATRASVCMGTPSLLQVDNHAPQRLAYSICGVAFLVVSPTFRGGFGCSVSLGSFQGTSRHLEQGSEKGGK
jgi:hypothetical protein